MGGARTRNGEGRRYARDPASAGVRTVAHAIGEPGASLVVPGRCPAEERALDVGGGTRDRSNVKLSSIRTATTPLPSTCA